MIFSPHNVWLAMAAWLSVALPCLAQDKPTTEHSFWWKFLEEIPIPILWGCGLMIAILTGTIGLHLLFVVRKSQINPPALTETLSRVIQLGNYQEAWEICNQGRQAVLARMLQPALERIGQGLESTQTRLVEESRREQRHFFWLLGSLISSGVIFILFCFLGIYVEFHGLAMEAMSPQLPRVRTLALANIAILAAGAFAVILPVGVLWIWLKLRVTTLLRAACVEGNRLIASLPYEEIEGVRIGRDFHAGTIFDQPGGPKIKKLRVSKELTSRCPTCNGPINPSRDVCLHCGQLLVWS